MNLLAIDSATDKLSVAITQGEEKPEKWLFEADAGLRHSELAMDIIDILVKKANLKPEMLSGIVCMGGPGSFTGLRIGFSVAKGIALSLGIPFAAIPTLDCIAWPFSALPAMVIPVIDAKKKSFFCAFYRSGKRLCPDMDAASDEIARAFSDATGYVMGASMPPEEKPAGQALLVGPGADLLYEQLKDKIPGITSGQKLRYGNAAILLEIAKETNIFANNANNYSIGPEYIRKSDAELAQL